jgi:endonuclease/exonuclease/phosphatase family metal-dependent hydrolase
MPSEEWITANERRELMNLMDSGPTKIPNRRVDENLILATWNIQNFGAKKSDRAIQYIADIVERFDIVAIQEVKTDLSGLARLQSKLPGNYKILVSDPTGNNERFAFLYDKRTVINTGLVCEIGFTVDPKTHTAFQLHRMPYCASFRAGRFDFVIVDAHIFFGKKKEEEFRAKEIVALVDFVISQSKSAKAFDQDFFLVGDFNIPDRNSRFFKPLADRGFIMPKGLDTMGTNLEGTKTYDKIAWVPRKSFSFSGAYSTLPFGDILFKESGSPGAKKEISDHRPLWAEFYINKLTQELDQIINRGS